MSQKIREQFIEQMGLVMQRDGLPRIAGRIFGFFVMHGGTHSFSELAERLDVSRGSISTNARLLESLGVLEKTALPGDRQDYFRLSDDPYGRLLRGYIKRMEGTRRLVVDTLDDMVDDAAAAARLADMLSFYAAMLEAMRKGLAGRAGTPG